MFYLSGTIRNLCKLYIGLFPSMRIAESKLRREDADKIFTIVFNGCVFLKADYGERIQFYSKTSIALISALQTLRRFKHKQ